MLLHVRYCLPRVSSTVLSSEILERLSSQHTITVSTGATCAYLGDERNLREYLVADEAVRQLRAAGHIVHFLLFNDDLDALTFRQLRVAVRKDPVMVDEFEPFCGKPISDIRAPYNAEGTWSQYFQARLAERLRELDCHPTILSISQMYARGMYGPYIKQVLLHQDRIFEYLHEKFDGYRPEKLFWPICPTCGYIDGASIDEVDHSSVVVNCKRCLRVTRLAFDELRGKLTWKLDCAARWAMFRVHMEPFSKGYLDPHAGSFHVANGLATTFFGAADVYPVHYGLVSMEKELGYKVIESMPASVLRSMFVRNYRTDLEITEERILTEANKSEVLPGFTYAAVVKQLLPTWVCDSRELNAEQRDILNRGLAFSRNFLKSEVKPFMPNRKHLEGIPFEILRQIQSLLQQVLLMRKAFGIDYTAFMGPTKSAIEKLGDQRRPVIQALRRLVHQEDGLPNSRFLFLLPVAYIQNLESLVDLYLQANPLAKTVHAVVQDPKGDVAVPPLKMVSGDRLAFDH